MVRRLRQAPLPCRQAGRIKTEQLLQNARVSGRFDFSDLCGTLSNLLYLIRKKKYRYVRLFVCAAHNEFSFDKPAVFCFGFYEKSFRSSPVGFAVDVYQFVAHLITPFSRCACPEGKVCVAHRRKILQCLYGFVKRKKCSAKKERAYALSKYAIQLRFRGKSL